MPRRKKGTRVLGPYRRGNGYVIVIIDGEDRVDRSFPTEAGAIEAIAKAEEELALEGPITTEKALEEYEAYLRAKGNKPSSISRTMRRVRSLVGTGRDISRPVGNFDGRGHYAQLSSSITAYGRPISVDSHRNALSETKTFGRWCVKKGYLRINPWQEIEPIGRKRKGKPQLRVDEARRFMESTLDLAGKEDRGAVAALCCLLLGLRASEVVGLVGRDVDDGGRLLWISDSKTEAGRRVVEVPEVLRSLLVELGRLAGQSVYPLGMGEVGRHNEGHGSGRIVQSDAKHKVFPHSRYWVRDQVMRLCRLAHVPVVSPHGLRGTHASLAMQAGASSALVAQSLGHAGTQVMLDHYAQKGAVDSGRSMVTLGVLSGGKK